MSTTSSFFFANGSNKASEFARGSNYFQTLVNFAQNLVDFRDVDVIFRKQLLVEISQDNFAALFFVGRSGTHLRKHRPKPGPFLPGAYLGRYPFRRRVCRADAPEEG